MAEDILHEAGVILRGVQITRLDEKLRLRWRDMEPRFWVYVIAPRYPHRGCVYKDVHIQLFHYGEASEKDAGSLLFGITDDLYVLSQVEEAFTKGEIKQIQGFSLIIGGRHLKSAQRGHQHHDITMSALGVVPLVDCRTFICFPNYLITPCPSKCGAMWICGLTELRLALRLG